MLVWGLHWEVDYAVVGSPAVTVNDGTGGDVFLDQWQQSSSRPVFVHDHQKPLSSLPTDTTKHPALFKNSAHVVLSFCHQTFIYLNCEAWFTNLIGVVIEPPRTNIPEVGKPLDHRILTYSSESCGV